MRTIAATLQTALDSGVTTLCWCWRVIRRDGVTLGFTDHDQPLTVAGQLHQAASARVEGDVDQRAGFAPGAAALAGVLNSTLIRETDVAGGLYDEATVEVRRVDWTNPSAHVLMWSGRFGEIRRQGARFEVELRGPAARLDRTIGRVLQRRCDAELGDARCGADVSGPSFTASASVTEVLDARRFVATGLDAFAADWFAGGVLTWASGDNAPARMRVENDFRSGAQTLITLTSPPAQALSAGDAFTITAGCDKRWRTCHDTFANVANFRGFPMIPGDDWLFGGPSAGSHNNGESLWTDRDS